MVDEKAKEAEPKESSASTRFFEEAAQHDGWSAIVKRPTKEELEDKPADPDESAT